jgi:hypothetical protein
MRTWEDKVHCKGVLGRWIDTMKFIAALTALDGV